MASILRLEMLLPKGIYQNNDRAFVAEKGGKMAGDQFGPHPQ